MVKQAALRLLHLVRPYVKLENIFLVLFLIFGGIFVSITPPGQNPDEPSHLFRAWQITEPNLLSETLIMEKKAIVGGYIPDDIVNFLLSAQVEKKSDAKFKFNHIDYSKLASTRVDDSRQSFQGFAGASLYSPVAYLPTVPVIVTSKILDLPFIYTFYLMRIAGLITLAILIYLSIRLTPIGKWILFTVGLLPSTVSQGAAITADSIAIGVAFVFIAYVLRLAYRKIGVSNRQSIILFILISVLALTKTTYAPLALLVLLIPLYAHRTIGKSLIVKLVLPVLGAGILTLIWLTLTSYIEVDTNSTSDISQQLAFIAQEPITFLKTMYYTFFTRESLSLVGFFGYFGWLTAPIADIYILILSVALTLAVLVKSPRELKAIKLSRHQINIARVILATTFCLIVCLIALSLYLYFTPLRQSSVLGIQGRYFLPIAPIFLLLFYGNNLQRQKNTKLLLVLILLISLIGGVVAAYDRYYKILPPILS